MRTQVNKEAMKLVVATVRKMATIRGKKITAVEANEIARVALLPPMWCDRADRWLDVCVRGLHSNYGGATCHYRASEMKWADELNEMIRDNGVALAA